MEIVATNTAYYVANKTSLYFYREIIALLKACAVKWRSEHLSYFTVNFVNSIECMLIYVVPSCS